MALTADQLQKFKATYPEALHLKAGQYEAVVRPPTREEWRRFKRLLGDDAKKPDAVESLFKDCCVYPAREELAALLERRPALAEKFGNHVVLFAVGAEEVETKNL